MSFLVSAPAAHAEQTVESIRLDSNTLQRGYTVTNGDLQVGIGAQLFEAEESFVKIKTLDEGDFPGAPEGMTLVSEPYVYMITMPESQICELIDGFMYQNIQNDEHQQVQALNYKDKNSLI